MEENTAEQAFRSAVQTSLPLLDKDRDVMSIMRELNDKMDEAIDLLKKRLPEGDPRIEEICGISNDMHAMRCHVLGGIGNAVCVTLPKKYMSRNPS